MAQAATELSIAIRTRTAVPPASSADAAQVATKLAACLSTSVATATLTSLNCEEKSGSMQTSPACAATSAASAEAALRLALYSSFAVSATARLKADQPGFSLPLSWIASSSVMLEALNAYPVSKEQLQTF
jgi:hypothetical protein